MIIPDTAYQWMRKAPAIADWNKNVGSNYVIGITFNLFYKSNRKNYTICIWFFLWYWRTCLLRVNVCWVVFVVVVQAMLMWRWSMNKFESGVLNMIIITAKYSLKLCHFHNKEMFVQLLDILVTFFSIDKPCKHFVLEWLITQIKIAFNVMRLP